MLGLPLSTDISRIHEVSKWHLDKSGNLVNELQVRWNAGVRFGGTARRSDVVEGGGEAFSRFDEAYRNFVRDVAAPAVGGGRVLFQRCPTLRVMVRNRVTLHFTANCQGVGGLCLRASEVFLGIGLRGC